MIDLSHLASSAPEQAPEFEGQWHALEFQPELETPQSFVIGVAMSRRGKLVCVRLAEEAPRLKCFYGQRFTPEVWNWLRLEFARELKDAVGKPVAKFESSSPQLRLGAGHYASGLSADATMARVFDRIVTVVRNDRKPRVQGIAQAQLREDMAKLLKLRMSTRFETISQASAGVQINESGTVHTFDISYDDNRTASTVVSGCYASLDAARLNVLTAANDLYRFLRIRQREQIGLAVLEPSTDTLPAEAVKTWQDWWAHESYKFKESSMVLVATAPNAEQLADQVIDWYPAAS